MSHKKNLPGIGGATQKMGFLQGPLNGAFFVQTCLGDSWGPPCQVSAMLATILARCAGLNVRFLFPDFIFMPMYFKYIRAHAHEVLEVSILEVDMLFHLICERKAHSLAIQDSPG